MRDKLPSLQKFGPRALCLGALLALGGTAQAANVLILNDTSNPQPDITHVRAACFSGDTVTVTDTLPTPVAPATLSSSYDQIWDFRSNLPTGLTAADQSAYVSYLQAGGRMALFGEYPGDSTEFDAKNASILNLVSTLGGGTLTMTGQTYQFNTSSQTVQAPFNTTPNDMTAMPVNYLAAGGVATAGTGQFITFDSTNNAGSAVTWRTCKLANAKKGSLSVVFDVNFTGDPNSTPATLPPISAGIPASVNNPPFLQNLCALVAASGYPPQQVDLTTSTPTLAVSHTGAVKATVTDDCDNPLPAGTTVTFTVTDGPNTGTTGTATTDADGAASFTYTGTVTGTDTVEAVIAGGTVSNTVTVEWQAGTPASSVPALGKGALAALGLLLGMAAGLGALRRRPAA